jgi:hypothetical protein
MRNYLKYSLILWLAINFHLKSQVNLIQNGSFEEILDCPDIIEFPIYSSIQFAVGWNDACSESVSDNLSSPDLFNSCNLGVLSVPSNWFGYQEPSDGFGYSGLGINSYPQGGIYREFIQNTLIRTIPQACKYKLSFRFSYATNFSYKTDGLQFIFSNSKLTIPNNAAILNGTFFTFDEDSVTIIRFPELLEADTTDWWYFEREFYSNAPARYLTIGSLLDSASTNNSFGWVTPFGGIQGKSGGYFDDIRLIQLDSNCVTGVNEIEKKDVVKVYPNPASNSLNIDNGQTGKPYTAQLIDFSGRVIQQEQFSGIGSHTLNLEGLAQGIYYCRIMQGNEVVVEKVVKIE